MTIHCSQQYLLVILIIRNQNPEAGYRTPTEHQDTALPPQTISPSSPPPPSHLPNNLETAICPQINIQCSEPPLSQISPKDSTQAPTPFLQPPARALLVSISKKSFRHPGKPRSLFSSREGDSAAHRESGLHTSITMDLVIRKGIFSFSLETASC